MMSSLKNILLLIFAGLFLASCDEEPETGSVSEELVPFHGLELNGVFEVYLIQDVNFSLRIEGDKDILKHVVFSVDEGILKVMNATSFKWMDPEGNKIKLFVTADRLSHVWPNETCRIESLNPIIADEFHIVMGHPPKLAEIDLELDNELFYYWNNHQCGGKVTLRGKTSRLMAYTFGYMSINAGALATGHAVIENNSKGDCEVQVRDKIEYSIRSVGDIYLYGNPEEIIAKDLTSSGALIKMD
jgi:hypothetical protein